MVETINPVVYGGRRRGWVLDVALHVLGATLAAAVFGAALGAVGWLLEAPWGIGGPVLVGGVALVYAVGGELLGRRLPVPQARRQVPDWWRTFFSRQVFSFLYGAGLGVGFLTYLSRGTLVAVAAAALASGRPAVGVLVMAPFGLARGASVLVARRAGTVEAATALVDRLVRSSGTWVWRALNAAALLAVAVTAGRAAILERDLGVEGLAAAVLAAVFAWAAVAKLVRPARWRSALEGYHLPAPLRAFARVAVPLTEGAVAVLAVGGLQRAAGAVALVLLVAFSGVVVRARALRGPQVPCGCFGGRTLQDYRLVLSRNAILILVALAALAGDGGRLRVWLPAPSGTDLLPAGLALAGIVVVAWAWARVGSELRSGRRA